MRGEGRRRAGKGQIGKEERDELDERKGAHVL